MIKLILASGSKARAEMLENAGLGFDIIPADIDETAMISRLRGQDPAEIARALANEKALAVALDHPDAVVIGADQILEQDDDLLQKASDRNEAAEKLRHLSGRTHRLISAVVVARGGQTLWQATSDAKLTMRALGDEELEAYLDKAGAALTRSVGAYELEGIGTGLFEKIDGDYFTILGLPLIPLLGYLREHYNITGF